MKQYGGAPQLLALANDQPGESALRDKRPARPDTNLMELIFHQLPAV